MLKDWILKRHFDNLVLNLEDDYKRQFQVSKAGKELLEVQKQIYFQTGSFLPDNFN